MCNSSSNSGSEIWFKCNSNERKLLHIRPVASISCSSCSRLAFLLLFSLTNKMLSRLSVPVEDMYVRRLYRRYIGPWTTLLWTGYSLVISTIQHGKSFQICTWPREQSEFVSVFSRSSRVGVIYCIENWRWAFAALDIQCNGYFIRTWRADGMTICVPWMVPSQPAMDGDRDRVVVFYAE